MKKSFTLIALLVLGFCSTFGQSPVDSLSMKKAFGGYQFFQGEQRLTMGQLVEAMKPNEQAYQEIKAAQSTYTMAMICSFAGGFMVGWPIGTALGGGDPNWTLAGIGAGLFVVSIPINQSAMKKTKLAVDTFNGGLRTSTFRERSELQLTMSGQGIGLSLRF
ncbi:MAG: hypothetical protein R2751_05755 [Bacteroidales bacterium]